MISIISHIGSSQNNSNSTRTLQIYAVCVISALLVIIGGRLANSASLTAIDTVVKSGQVTLSLRFDEEVRYTVQTGEDGKSLLLRLPGTVPAQGLADNTAIPENTIVRGYGMRTAGGVLEVEFLLTGPSSYAHNVTDKPFTVTVDVYGGSGGTGQTGTLRPSRISRGMELYREGRFDEALSEFNEEVNASPRSPLSYYYAARIRLEKSQYARAEKNLQAALRDSVNFTDARGLLAYTRKKMNKTGPALADWKKFVQEAGRDDGIEVSVEGIVLPEDYRSMLAEVKRRREEAAALAAKEAAAEAAAARRDSLEAAERDLAADTEADFEADTVTDNVSADSLEIAGAQTTVPPAEDIDGDIERRMRTNITYGLFGLAVSGVLLVCGLAGVAVWVKRRMAPPEEVTFAREIATMLEAEDVSDEDFEREEERAIREYQVKSRAIRTNEPDYVSASDNRIDEEQAPSYERPLSSRLPAAPISDRSHAITEEVKALVMKMHREGRSATEIASTADLTRTEVDLILAVRARHVERLVSEAATDSGNDVVADHMFRAIGEMHSEGRTVRDIARKMNISTSEVQLAVSLLNMYRPRQL